ncbi:TetR family transcriptional regulator [Paenibacillus camerounensis]|uniref:TetR family transcriptional regulator n=1 Tax=Paenibacillus camerounensis TaxID=1243663 RepID=UPI0005A78F0D|nr:TetR family transcriptional regulator [Paenibacillus camerounensis]
MTFKRARSDEHVQERMNEIIYATSKIYDSIGYEGLNFSEISKLTKFTRPTIYRYFNTKEEILLEILNNDFKSWHKSLLSSFRFNKVYAMEEIVEIWVNAIVENERLLKLYSILFTSIEKNVSLDSLTKFKKDTIKLQDEMTDLLMQLFPKTESEDILEFFNNQMVFAAGLFPLTVTSQIQLEAIELSGTDSVPTFISAFKTIVYQLLFCLERGVKYPARRK